jgi:signal transduction histidine kinase
MEQNLQFVLELIKAQANLSEQEKSVIISRLNEADKKMDIAAFRIERSENVHKTMSVLLEETIDELEQKRKAVEEKNRVLEIEAALERVRTVGMGMRKPEDLLNVCKILFEELTALGFSELRSAMINIVNDEKGSFLNYDFQSDGTATVIPFLYNSHPVITRQVEITRSASDAFIEHAFTGDELEDFKAFRVSNGELPDPKLENISSLYYYFYSIGIGSVGISTFNSLTEEKREVLKRFRNVFDLAYRRYADIGLAEAQAREAHIETALERVRSRSMGMQKSQELKEIIQVVYEQFVQLNIPIGHAGFIMDYDTRDDMFIWLADKHEVPFQVTIPYFDSAHWNSFNHAKEKGTGFFANQLTFEEKNKFYQDLFKLVPGVADEAKEYYFNCPGLAISTVLLDNVGLYIENFAGVPYSDEENATLMRFGKVFQQTYTRFNDLKQAEEQARESKIEVALERVRSQTMAMRKTDELGETASLVFHQLQLLGAVRQTDRFSISIIDEATGDAAVWITKPGGQQKLNSQALPMKELGYYSKKYHGWKKFPKLQRKELLILNELEGPELAAFEKFITRYTDIYDDDDTKASPALKLFQLDAYFSHGCLTVTGLEATDAATQNIVKRFASIFEQTYVRFLDLQNAEAQAREARIEAALEKVRSCSLAMHQSKDLRQVVDAVFEKLREQVDIVIDGVSILIPIEGSKDLMEWVAGAGQSYAESFRTPYIDNPMLSDLISARESGADFFSRVFDYDEKNALWQHALEHSGYKNLPDEIKKKILESKHYAYSVAFEKHSAIVIASISGQIVSEKESEILKRFARVFEQSYIRFLDLQKAEAQAKEALIEASLERVRSKTMAMHNSHDVAETVAGMFDELLKLGIKKDVRSGIGIFEVEQEMEVWTAYSGPDGKVGLHIGSIDITSHQMLEKTYNCWKNKDSHSSYTLTGEDQKDYYRAINNSSHYEAKFDLDSLPPNTFQNAFYFSEGFIFVFSSEQLTAEEVQLFKRFAGVFSLTYRRFLDLEKAEKQAREAQIEAALERVRSRTMGMQKSEELTEVAALLFKQVNDMGIKTWTTGFNVWSEDNNSFKDYITSPQGGFIEPYTIDLTQTSAVHELFEARKSGEEFFVYYSDGERLKEIYRALSKFGDKKQYEKMLEGGRHFPSHQFNHFVFGSNVSLMFITYDAVPQAHDIFKRFGKVFEQTYTRFNDLKQAEAQAREAKIEAALEKVRGKALAMYSSQDLSSTASMVFSELRKLGINPLRCGVGMMNKKSRKVALYTATTSAASDSLALIGWVMLAGHPVLDNIYGSLISGKDYFPVLKGKQLKAYYNKLLSGLSLPSIPDGHRDEEYGHFFPFADGCLYAWSEKRYDETEIRILKRFASVIDLTFRRYIELQKSEASARDAIREASLDRIRAEIASMRTTNDLKRITPLIWNELTVLGVPFIRCGVFIIDEQEQLIHTHLSTADGKALATFSLQFDSEGIGQNVLPAWRKKQVATIHWTKKEFAAYTQNLVNQGTVKSRERYVTEHPDTSLDLHFLPFLQGMLYVGNIAPLTVDEMNLVQSLADAFASAYARYEDFNKLEAAKQEVEKTLTQLKSAQTKLIQSEKMASLGELTAGIAHEIQNPLNFVNNFSEVSAELIDDLEAELDKGDTAEAKAIAADIKQNLEKIRHHGKRADGIVKGMLQHSRSASGEKQSTNINALADEFLRLSYHGLRAKDKTFNVEMVTHFDPDLPKIDVIPQDIGRVMLNLFNNAFYAVHQKQKTAGGRYKPEVTVKTARENGQVVISVKDNGNGIPDGIKNKIMQPFFTTKPTGEGIGLGLSISYDIVVKGHGGAVELDTKENEFTEFIISLPNH